MKLNKFFLFFLVIICFHVNVNSSDRTPFDDICSERTPNEIYNKLLATCKRFQAEKNISLLLEELEKFSLSNLPVLLEEPEKNLLGHIECLRNFINMWSLVDKHISDGSEFTYAEIKVFKAIINLYPWQVSKRFVEEKSNREKTNIISIDYNYAER